MGVLKDGGVVGQVLQELARIGQGSCLLKYCTIPHATVHIFFITDVFLSACLTHKYNSLLHTYTCMRTYLNMYMYLQHSYTTADHKLAQVEGG